MENRFLCIMAGYDDTQNDPPILGSIPGLSIIDKFIGNYC